MHVRRDDSVKVICGKDRGKTGKVLRVFPGKRRVIVEGLNIVKKHVRGNPGKQEKGGIIEKTSSLHISSVMLYCAKCNQATRAGHRVLKDGVRVRYCKKCQEML